MKMLLPNKVLGISNWTGSDEMEIGFVIVQILLSNQSGGMTAIKQKLKQRITA